MRLPSRPCVALLVLFVLPAFAAAETTGAALARVEQAFLDHLDAADALRYVDAGTAPLFDGRTRAQWQDRRASTRAQLDRALDALDPRSLTPTDARALEALRRTLAALDTERADAATAPPAPPACSDARGALPAPVLRAALEQCFVEHGNHLRFGDGEIDRGTALQRLHVLDDPAARKALFEAFVPLWSAVNGANAPDSPYRRLVAQASAGARDGGGSEIDAAARALGLDVPAVERWLVRILEAWHAATPGDPVEPWDFRYAHGRAHRELHAHVPARELRPVNRRFFADLGADLDALRVDFDLAPRPGKSPLAYSDFLARGRNVAGRWQRPRARVLGSYPDGGLFSLNELVHESGHAVHVSAIATRPAYMDWPDTLFTEAFADVPSWSVYEPAWQRRYLGGAAAVDERDSLRALYAGVVLDVAWALFELRLLREPATDPNRLWTEITQRYLRIVPHPEVPWWAQRVQLVSDPGYMVNYGLGAVLTAELRAQTARAIGAFDTGNARWYGWLGDRLLRHGAERDTRTLMHALLGRPVSPDALLAELRRIAPPDARARVVPSAAVP